MEHSCRVSSTEVVAEDRRLIIDRSNFNYDESADKNKGRTSTGPNSGTGAGV